MLNIENVYVIVSDSYNYYCGEYDNYYDTLEPVCPAFKDYESAVKYLEDLWPGRHVDEKCELDIDSDDLTPDEKFGWPKGCERITYRIIKLTLK